MPPLGLFSVTTAPCARQPRQCVRQSKIARIVRLASSAHFSINNFARRAFRRLLLHHQPGRVRHVRGALHLVRLLPRGLPHMSQRWRRRAMHERGRRERAQRAGCHGRAAAGERDEISRDGQRVLNYNFTKVLATTDSLSSRQQR